jgi:hypothetical protein
MTWREFVRAHRQSLLAVDVFTVETIWLQRLYILFFIELGSRRVHVAGCTANPSAPWVIQQARHLSWTLAERAERIRFLIRDRDQKFTDAFDEVFRADGIEVVQTPFRAPQVGHLFRPSTPERIPDSVPAADHVTVDLVGEGLPRMAGDKKAGPSEVDMLPYGRSSPAAVARHL